MRRIRLSIEFLLCGLFVYSAQGAADPNELAHDLFGPSLEAISLDAKISGPDGAISKYSSKHSEIKTGSKSGVAFKTGGSAFQPAPGDEQLSKAIGKQTAEAATMTVQFRPTTPRKIVRLNVTMVSEETAERLRNGFDEVFAVWLDGKMIMFIRAADTKEPTDQQKSENPNSPRMVNVSNPLDLSEAKLHLLKISIASVGDGGGPSTAVVSVEGEPGSETYPPFLAGNVLPPTPPEPETPTKTGPAQRFDPPVVPIRRSFPPPPPIILEGGGKPVRIPDGSSSLISLLIGCILLVLMRRRTRAFAK